MPRSGNSADQAHIPTHHYRDLNEGPFSIKTGTTAGARSVVENVGDNEYCSECVHRDEMAFININSI